MMSVSIRMCLLCCIFAGGVSAIVASVALAFGSKLAVLQVERVEIVQDGVLLARIGARDGAGELTLFDSNCARKEFTNEEGAYLRMGRRPKVGGGEIVLSHPVKGGGVTIKCNRVGGSSIGLADGQSEGQLVTLSAGGGEWEITGKDTDTTPTLLIKGSDAGASLEIFEWDKTSGKYHRIRLKD